MKKIRSLQELNYARYLNERGFTLVEMLFSFSIFLMIIFFISPIFQVMQNNHLQERIHSMEWDIFCSQMKKEIRMSSNVQVAGGNTLILTEDSGTIVYEKYENSLRRRVNYSGHEILLQNVSQVNFTLLKNAVKTSIKDLSGKDYTIVVFSFLNWNGAQ